MATPANKYTVCPWWSLAHRCIAPISPYVFPRCGPLAAMCMSVSLPPLLIRIAVITSGPTLSQYDLILTNYICKDPISK